MAANDPVPVLLEWNTTVRHPEVFPLLADTTWPCNPLPVHVPRTGAAVLLPSWMVIPSTGAAPARLKLNVMKLSEMAPPATSGHKV